MTLNPSGAQYPEIISASICCDVQDCALAVQMPRWFKTHSPRVHGAHSLVLHSLCSPVYVVELDWYPDAPGEMVVLTCNTPEEEGIIWTSAQSNEVLGSGKTLTIQVKEFGDAGQYTCHKGGEVLSHSHLLLHKKEDGVWSTDILKDQKGNAIPLDHVSFLLLPKRYKCSNVVISSLLLKPPRTYVFLGFGFPLLDTLGYQPPKSHVETVSSESRCFS